MRAKGKVPKLDQDEAPKGELVFRLASLALDLKPSEGKLLIELLEHDAIIPLRKVMAAVITLADAVLDNTTSSRERVDIARGQRRGLRLLDEALCEQVPLAYRAMVKSIEAREAEPDEGPRNDPGRGAEGHSGTDGHDEPGPG